MRSMRQLFRTTLLVAVTGVGASAQEHADLILTGGKIATMRHGESFVQAIAIKDGLVHSVGTDDEMLRLKGESTRVVPLGGRTVIPGLNDSHSHVVRGGRFYNLELRWDGVPSLAQALAMIREQAARTPEGQWVRVIGGWSPYQFAEQRMPTIAELNEAAPDTPVFVLFLYSKGFLNRAGVQALGIDATTEPPKGSRYRFADGGAELLAEPNPTILYQTIGALPSLSAAQQANSTRHYYRELNRFGLTSAIDAGGGGHSFPVNYVATKELAEHGELPLRISYFLFPQRPGKELEDFTDWTANNEVDVNADIRHQEGYVLQGGGEFLTWAAGDFENFMAPRPVLQRAMDLRFEAVASLLVQNGWSFRIHATYGESIARILEVLQRVDAKQSLRGVRWAIDHAETIRPEQIQHVQRLGGGVAVQNRMAFAGEYFVERYGQEAAATAPPLRALFDSGIPLAAGTDATRVSSYNPWLSLYWMVSGRTVGGTLLYPPENRLTRVEALQLYTSGSAWLSDEESRKGRLMPGHFADLAVLSADYFTIPEEDIRAVESVLTIVGGVPVYGAGAFADSSPRIDAVDPPWSPVARFGGYHVSPTQSK